MVLSARNIVSNNIVNTVSAMDTENDVIIRGWLDLFSQAVSAMSANHIALTKYMSKRKKYDLFWRDLMRPVKRKNVESYNSKRLSNAMCYYGMWPILQ